MEYLVNDGSINISSLFKEKLIFFGERHGSSSDIKFVRILIERMEPDYVLVEGLADLQLTTDKAKQKALKVDSEDFYYGDLTKMWVDVSRDYDIPFIGIELTKRDKDFESLELAERFRLREEHWLREIKKYAKASNVVIVVCGDTHLRTLSCKELGDVSPFYKAFPKATFIRLGDREID